MSGAAAPPRDPPSATEPACPVAFATAEPQDRELLGSAALRSAPRPSVLGASVTTLRGAGPRLADAAAELGITALGELLLHVPRSYRDLSAPRLLAELRIGEQATVEVEVRSSRLRRTRRRGLVIIEATVADESGPAKAVWFNQAWLAERLQAGTRLLLYGKLDRSGFRVEAHEFLPAGDGTAQGAHGAAPAGLHTVGIVPVHPASERLRAQRLREWAWQAMPMARHALEPLPAELRARRRLPGAADSLAIAHFPSNLDDAERARHRLAFEELFLHQAALVARRRGREASRPGIALGEPGESLGRWQASLPFELTGDQRRAIADIDADLGSERPMQRLLMGEVGSGKTVLAAYAMLRAVEAGFQAALMAPTETLAEQHSATLHRLISDQVGEAPPLAAPRGAHCSPLWSPARRRPRGAARRLGGSPRGSWGWWWGLTR